jgi:hypothetical protein
VELCNQLTCYSFVQFQFFYLDSCLFFFFFAFLTIDLDFTIEFEELLVSEVKQ